MNESQNAQKEQFLIIKHGALGDMIQGLDAFESLRKSFASAHLTLLTSPPFDSLSASMPYFDSVISDKRAPLYQIGQLLQIRGLFAKEWTAVIDLQCSKRTAVYYNWFYKKPGRKWFGTVAGCSHPMPNFTNVNNRNRMLEAVKMLGASEHKADLSWLCGNASPVIDSFGIQHPYCIIIPGSSAQKPSKRWAAKNYAHLSIRMNEFGIKSYLVGTKTETPIGDEICALNPNVENLINRTNLAELAQLCANAKCVIGNDTGPTFLAACTSVPTLMLMGADTNPNMSSPMGVAADYIYQANIQNIKVEDVLNALNKLGGM
ncbi:MAG: glycosyltransferase family 9 protein [Alphaproteobacteria bacterium]|nr:glycosyltransferase family 9 protein [Alphaproteobacteria bacterium]